MNKYRIKEVITKKDIKIFLELPLSIYKDDSNWIRPLDKDIEDIFSPSKNVLFNGGEAIRWIAFDEEDNCVGRIAAFYNNYVIAKEDYPTGGCGFFESLDDKELAHTLFDCAKDWLVSKGMKAMDGPINFGSRSTFWGLLVDGYYPPMHNMNYNHKYYEALFDSYGFQNYFNQHSYIKYIENIEVSPVVTVKSDRLTKSGEYTFRNITKEDYPDVGDKFRGIYNKAWGRFSGVELMTKEKSDNLFKQIKPIIDKKLIIFAYQNDKMIGFFIMIPNLYDAIKHLNGNFNFWSKLKFMYYLKIKKCCKSVNAMIFAVDPDYQGKGVESGIIEFFCKNIRISNREKYTHLEIVWIGDFNPLMMRMVESYVDAKKYKRHTTYRYIMDKSIEFKRCKKVSVSKKLIEK